MIKIGIDANRLLDDTRGVGRYTHELLKKFNDLENDFQFNLFYNSFNSDFKKNVFKTNNLRFNNHYFSIPTRFFELCWPYVNFPKIESLIGKIDIFHSPVFYLPPPSKASLIVTIHDLAPMFLKGKFSSSYLKYYERGLKLIEKRANGIIAVSEHTLNDLKKLISIKNKEVIVISNGLEKRFKPIRKTATGKKVKTDYGIEKEFFLYVGGASINKNIQTLIQAYAVLPDAIKAKFDLAIAGKINQDFDELKIAIERLNVRNNVKLVGYVKEDDLPLLYSEAKLFIFPSLYEGFGFTPLEAMACGVPVLSSYRTSLKEVLGGAAMEIDPENADDISSKIVEMLNDEDQRNSFIEKGMKQTKNYTWEKSAGLTLDFYKKFV